MKLERHHSEQDGRRLGQARVGSPEPPTVVEKPAERDGGCAEPVGEPMKCVWSGYPDYNRDCRSRIPASVVIKAWHREIQLKGTVEGFYYFSWRNGVWLAYGLRDGGVRGVYCPTHCVDRDSRGSQGEDPQSQRGVGEGASSTAPTDPPIRRAVGSSSESAVRAARLGVALR